MTFNRKAFLSLLVVSALTACGGGGSEETSTTPVVETPANTAPVANTPPVANTAPVANAGEDKNIYLGEQITLDGSSSSDADGDSLSYKWSITSAPSSSFTLEATANPSFTPSVQGEYVISLIVNDGKDNSESDTVVVTVIKPNVAPVAVISAEPVGTQGVKYLLNGETSSDEDGDTLTYAWSFSSIPDGSSLTSDSLAQEVETSFTPDVAGDYEIQLVVNDGEDSSELVSHSVSVEANAAPEVTASIDINYNFGGEAYIYSSVTDNDSSEFTYSWEITSVPEGSNLLGFTFDKPYLTYIPDVAGNYSAKVIVNDGFNTTESEIVTATINEQYKYGYRVGGNSRYFGKVNEPVLIDFADSTSPNGKELNYTWTVRSGPNGSRPSTSTSIVDKAETEFTGDKAGTYRIYVTITDEDGNRAVKSVYVTLSEPYKNIIPESEVSNPHFIQLGEEITIDGRNSFDIDKDILRYNWRVGYQPPTSMLFFEDISSVNQTFTPTQPGYYRIELRTYDGENTTVKVSSAWFYVYENKTKTIAQTDEEVYAKEGETITLNGSDSVGVDDSVTVIWDLINAPYNSTSEIVGSDTLNPTFDLDVDGKFVFQLRLIKNEEIVSIRHLTVRSEENARPIANAGEDVAAVSGERVELTAEQSLDQESDPLTYQWDIVGISGEYTVVPSLTVDSEGGAYLQTQDDFVGQVVLGLTVSDNENSSVRDEVIVTFDAPVAATRLTKGILSPLEVPLPYESKEVIQPMSSTPSDGVQILEVFNLYADYADFTMTNIKFSDKNDVVEPVLRIVDYNYALPADQQVELDYSQDITIDANNSVQISIISPANTGGEKALIELSFEILETGETFKAEFEFTSG